MREYAPVAVVVAALCLLVAVAYHQVTGPHPAERGPFLIELDPEVAQALRRDDVKLVLLAAGGKSEGKATVEKWEVRDDNTLVVGRFAGPQVTYKYLLVYWSNGAASLHNIQGT